MSSYREPKTSADYRALLTDPRWHYRGTADDPVRAGYRESRACRLAVERCGVCGVGVAVKPERSSLTTVMDPEYPWPGFTLLDPSGARHVICLACKRERYELVIDWQFADALAVEASRRALRPRVVRWGEKGVAVLLGLGVFVAIAVGALLFVLLGLVGSYQ